MTVPDLNDLHVCHPISQVEEIKREFDLTTDELLFALISPTKMVGTPCVTMFVSQNLSPQYK